MKKSVFTFCLFFVGLSWLFAQSPTFYTEQTLKRKAIDSVSQYLHKHFDPATFDKHIHILEEDVFIYYTIPSKTVKKDSISTGMIRRIEVFSQFTTEHYKGSISLEVGADGKVIEKMRMGEPVNLTVMFIQAHLQYLQALNEGKILPSARVLDFVKQQHPKEEWSEPKVTRMSFPPYSFHYHVFQNNCSPCNAVNVSLTTLEELNTETYQMIPINAK